MHDVLLLCALAAVTSHAQTRGTIVDARDGQKYQWTKIDGVVWMAENLNYAMDGSFCYDNNPANCAKYGRLYTWDAAMKACTTGWHLPTREEWDELKTTLGEDAATKLKSKDWDGTDAIGFNALPAGFLINFLSNNGSGFDAMGSNAYFWTATEDLDYNAYLRALHSNDTTLYSDYENKNYAFSVRCVKDSQ